MKSHRGKKQNATAGVPRRAHGVRSSEFGGDSQRQPPRRRPDVPAAVQAEDGTAKPPPRPRTCRDVHRCLWHTRPRPALSVPLPPQEGQAAFAAAARAPAPLRARPRPATRTCALRVSDPVPGARPRGVPAGRQLCPPRSASRRRHLSSAEQKRRRAAREGLSAAAPSSLGSGEPRPPHAPGRGRARGHGCVPPRSGRGVCFHVETGRAPERGTPTSCPRCPTGVMARARPVF